MGKRPFRATMAAGELEGDDMGAEAPSQSAGAPERSSVRRALRRVDPHVWDTALAFGLCVAGFVYVLAGPSLSPDFRSLDALGAVLLLAMTLPLVAVHSYPRVAFATIAGASVLGAVFDQPAITVGYLCGAVALFFVAARSDIWRSLMAGMLASLTLIAIFGILLSRGDATIWLAIAAWFVFSAVWLAGMILHAYRENVSEARKRAQVERERADLYLHDLEMRAQEAVALERGRLARELHDVVGHALNVVVLQAGAAQRVFDKRPETVRESLGSIEATGRQALSDIERLLGILRAEAGDREELGAQPGMADVDVPRRAGPRGRPRGHDPGPVLGDRAAVEPRSLRLSHRAGGPHQHLEARRQRGARDRQPALRCTTGSRSSASTTAAVSRRPASSTGASPADAACWACANASPCSAASSRSGRCPQGAFA